MVVEELEEIERRLFKELEELKRSIKRLRIAIERMYSKGCGFIGESKEEQDYLKNLANIWSGGCEDSSGEFLAPLTLLWALIKGKLRDYPDLEREARIWIALNRVLWNVELGIDWRFLRIDEKEVIWRYRLNMLKKIIEIKNPSLAGILAVIRSRDEVPELLYSLISNKLYKATRADHGVKVDAEVSIEELDKEILEKYEWLEPVTIVSMGHLRVEYVILKSIPTNYRHCCAHIVIHNSDKHNAHYGKIYIIIKEYETDTVVAIGKANAGTRENPIPPVSSSVVTAALKYINSDGDSMYRRRSTWVVLNQIE